MSNKRILVANADPHRLAEYGRALEQEWTVKLVTGPEAALAEMAAQPFDVLVADCALAGANQGVELLDRIHTDFHGNGAGHFTRPGSRRPCHRRPRRRRLPASRQTRLRWRAACGRGR